MPSSRGSSQPRDRTGVSCFAGRFLPSEPPAKPRGLQGPGIIGGRGRPVVPAAGIEGTQTQRPVRAEAARGRTTPQMLLRCVTPSHPSSACLWVAYGTCTCVKPEDTWHLLKERVSEAAVLLDVCHVVFPPSVETGAYKLE